MKNIDKEYQSAWEKCFENLTSEQQDLILAAPTGKSSAVFSVHVERLVDASRAAKGKGAGAELQLVERLEMENPL
jgi:hypothetical protein